MGHKVLRKLIDNKISHNDNQIHLFETNVGMTARFVETIAGLLKRDQRLLEKIPCRLYNL